MRFSSTAAGSVSCLRRTCERGRAMTTLTAPPPAARRASVSISARPACAIAAGSLPMGTRAASASTSAPSTTRGSHRTATPSPKARIGRSRRRCRAARGAAGTSGASSPIHQRQNAGRPSCAAPSRSACRKLLSAYSICTRCRTRVASACGPIGRRRPGALLPQDGDHGSPRAPRRTQDRFAHEGYTIRHRRLRPYPPHRNGAGTRTPGRRRTGAREACSRARPCAARGTRRPIRGCRSATQAARRGAPSRD